MGAARDLLRPPYWLCLPATPTCRRRHPFITFRESENGSTLIWRGDMHLLLKCKVCSGMSFGILHTRPYPLLHMFDIDARQYVWIKEQPDDTDSIEILRHLGYMDADPSTEHPR